MTKTYHPQSIHIYHVDAFTSKIFSGNPAAVCILETWLTDTQLTNIAQENNLPVTAFVVREKDIFHIRWITPDYELDLCGHGTLAASYVIFNYVEKSWQQISFQFKMGSLEVHRQDDLITLRFPARTIERVDLPLLVQGLGHAPQAIYQYQEERCFAIYETEQAVRELNPDIAILKGLAHRGITVTAPGDRVDFVSRTFYPAKTICEDAVTGVAHCFLVPYWAERLNKNLLHAEQVSKRGGELFCEYQEDVVLLSSKAVIYKIGEIFISV